MEQQRAEQIAALTHDLKTPLSIIQGNADLLAEDALSADQQTQVEAILRGTDRAQQYLAALRTACAPSAAGETFPQSHPCQWVGGNSPRPLRTCRGAAYTERAVAGDTVRGAVRPAPGCRKPAGQRRALYAPRRHCHTVGYKRKTGFHPACDRYRPRLHCRGPRQSGELLYTEAARSDTTHQGFGLYFARRVALSHSGTLRLSNTPGGCAELRLPICEQIEK